jgi:hypothetical protein
LRKGTWSPRGPKSRKSECSPRTPGGTSRSRAPPHASRSASRTRPKQRGRGRLLRLGGRGSR